MIFALNVQQNNVKRIAIQYRPRIDEQATDELHYFTITPPRVRIYKDSHGTGLFFRLFEIQFFFFVSSNE